MKNLLLFLFAAAGLSFSPAAAQQTITIEANMLTGVGVQKGRLDNAWGMGGTFEMPFKTVRALKFTAGLGFGINGFKTMPVELSFNGSSTKTDVNYTSYLFQLAPGLKYVFREGKKWSPYCGLSAGLLSYYTDMSVEDPNDPLGCSPIDTKPVSYSMVLMCAAETGIRIKMRQRRSGSLSYIEAGVGYIAGSRGRYLQFSKEMNMDSENMDDAYMIKFKQNSTGIVHEHGIGAMHKTAASQLAVHIGLVFPII